MKKKTSKYTSTALGYLIFVQKKNCRLSLTKVEDISLFQKNFVFTIFELIYIININEWNDE